jgi:hypothetical protein
VVAQIFMTQKARVICGSLFIVMPLQGLGAAMVKSQG